MTNLAEALGMTLPGCAAIPAPDARRKAIAELSGRRIVEMVDEDLRPSRILTREAFENAVTTLMALGRFDQRCRSPASRSPGVWEYRLTLDDFDRLSRTTPCIANIKPSGEYLMEDFFHSGGLPALLRNILPLASPRLPHRERQEPRRERRELRKPGMKMSSGRWSGRFSKEGGHRDPARQSLPGRRGDQAVRRLADCCSIAAKRTFSRTTKTWKPRSIRIICRSTATAFW